MSDEMTDLIETRSRDPELLTWYRFVRVLRKVIAQMDDLMLEMEVSRSQFDLLMQIAFDEGINQQTCAERMNVTKGNIAQHIARMEKQGLVQRQKIGRTNVLRLTETGRDLVVSILPVHDQRVKTVLSALSSEEVQQFQTIMRRFDRSIA
jgi:DNA-binding MarR family transcriptional regulator